MQPILQQKVKLSFAAVSLKSKDLLSASDPYLKLYEKSPTGPKREIFKTNSIQNNNNPVWAASCDVVYQFEVNQQYLIEIFDHDSNSANDPIGSCMMTLGQLMAAPGTRLSIPLCKPGKTKPSKKMAVIVTGTAMVTSKLHANLKLRAKLDKSSVFAALDKDDCAFQLLYVRPDRSEVVVYHSEICWDTQKPKWKPTTVSLGELVGGDPHAKFTLRVLRRKSNGNDEVMGENTNLVPHQLLVLPGQPEKKVDVFNSKGKDVGDFFFELFEIYEKHSFLDYLAGGLDMNLTVAIDHTGSNGAPSQPSSLHYVDPTGVKRNQYIDAIRSIGSILANYAQKHYIPALGFGGFVSVDGAQPVTSHCYPLTLSTAHPFCEGVEGVVQAYCTALQYVQLSGPTYFAPVIQSALAGASARPYAPDYQHFSILLLIADGVVNDMDATIDAIVQASDKPLCIIIVGVGNADFSDMEKLDADKKALKSKKYGESRNDIVQFVQFNQFSHDPAKLAEATLKEIPATVERFMAMHKIPPVVRQAVVMAPAAPPQ